MKKFFVIFIAVILVLSLVSCSSDKKEEPATSETEGGEVINIGFIGPLEGDVSVYGIAVSNGGEMALNDYNEANGTNYKLVKMDSKGDSTEAVNAYNKLVDESKVAGILGGTVSGESIAVGTASQGIGTPIISPSATAKEFTLTGSNVFRGCFTDPYQAKVMAEFAVDKLGAKTAAIIYDTGSDYSKGMAENFSAAFEAKGSTVVENEGYNTGDVDFNAQLTKIAASDVDVLFVPNYYKDDYLIAKQARDLGIKATILGGDGWDGILEVADDVSNIEGAIYVNHYAPDDAKVAEWVQKYKDTYSIDPNAFSVLGYDSMNILLEAISSADSKSPEDVVAAMVKTDYNGILGNLKFDENGDPIKDLAFIVIKDGQSVTYGE